MHRNRAELEAGLTHIRQSPMDQGLLKHIVCRPAVGERRVVGEAELDTELGLVGDNWLSRGYGKIADGPAPPDMQLDIMNARVVRPGRVNTGSLIKKI